jgi:hypothetical protein
MGFSNKRANIHFFFILSHLHEKKFSKKEEAQNFAPLLFTFLLINAGINTGTRPRT